MPHCPYLGGFLHLIPLVNFPIAQKFTEGPGHVRHQLGVEEKQRKNRTERCCELQTEQLSPGGHFITVGGAPWRKIPGWWVGSYEVWGTEMNSKEAHLPFTERFPLCTHGLHSPHSEGGLTQPQDGCSLYTDKYGNFCPAYTQISTVILFYHLPAAGI